VARDLKAGEPLEADVVDLAHDGRGIARLAGKAVFIEGALPGERVRFRVIKRRRRLEEAMLVDIVTASPDRVTPRCPHFGLCGGCSLQHLAPHAQLAAKQRQLLDNLERIGGVRPLRVIEALQGPAFAYRRRARLGVKYVHKKGRVLAGFRERDKPYLADLRRCEILLERFATLPEELAGLVETLSIREHIPQVEVAAGDATAALVFRIMAPLSAEDEAALARFGTRLGVQIHLQPKGLDSIRPLLPNAPPLEYAVDGGEVTIEFGPSDFVQINRDVNLRMVEAALELLAPGPADTVLDLFCGLGNFTLPLSRRAAAVVGVEGDEGLVHKARRNALRNGIGNAAFFTQNLFEPAGFGAWAERAFDLVLLDPPRAGAIEIMERMAQWRPRRAVYISCHPGSLARDAGILVRGQGYRLIGAGVMDMFPHTTHVESIAVFEHGA
jgi:23S rRNA (uracil1939-C5)-methyltransferase